MWLLTKEIFHAKCLRTTGTWVYEALNVLHHQLTGQTDGMLEVRGGHIPVRMVFMATAEPEGHHRKEKMNNCIDPKPRPWKRKVSVRIVISATLLRYQGSSWLVSWQCQPLLKERPVLWEGARKNLLPLTGEYRFLMALFFFVSAWF